MVQELINKIEETENTISSLRSALVAAINEAKDAIDLIEPLEIDLNMMREEIRLQTKNN